MMSHVVIEVIIYPNIINKICEYVIHNKFTRDMLKVCVYPNGLTYRDADGSSHLRSCLHDALINAAPIIGGNCKN